MEGARAGAGPTPAEGPRCEEGLPPRPPDDPSTANCLATQAACSACTQSHQEAAELRDEILAIRKERLMSPV
jgi:hypothetical protein